MVLVPSVVVVPCRVVELDVVVVVVAMTMVVVVVVAMDEIASMQRHWWQPS